MEDNLLYSKSTYLNVNLISQKNSRIMFDQIPGPCIPLKLTHKINHHITPIITTHSSHCLYWSILNKCLYCTHEGRINSCNKYLLPKNLGLKRIRLFFSYVMNSPGWGAPGQLLSSAPVPKATLATADPGLGRGMVHRDSVGQAGKWPTSPKEKLDDAVCLCAQEEQWDSCQSLPHTQCDSWWYQQVDVPLRYKPTLVCPTTPFSPSEHLPLLKCSCSFTGLLIWFAAVMRCQNGGPQCVGTGSGCTVLIRALHFTVWLWENC